MTLVKIRNDIAKGVLEKAAAEAAEAKAGKAAEEAVTEEESVKGTEEKDDKTVTILGIESSCDETAAAVVENGRHVLSNVIYSQVPVHTLYGGVVPEIA